MVRERGQDQEEELQPGEEEWGQEGGGGPGAARKELRGGTVGEVHLPQCVQV